MTVHPDLDVLGAYSAGKLPEEACRTVETHLSDCDTCGEALDRLSVHGALLDRLRHLGNADAFAVEESWTWLERLKEMRPESIAQDDEMLRRGRLGQYTILAKRGSGGMGAVYRAVHALMQREVAVKVLPRRLIANRAAQERFLREVQLLAKLDHPHVVRAYDAGVDDGVPYLVMEYVPGIDCQEHVKRHGPFSVSRVCDLLAQAADALQHAHEQRFVHRDIKPSNLLLNPDATQIKISDLGLARAEQEALGDSTVSELTAEGIVVGTPDFLAPEQWQDARRADIRADLYSLGCTAYFLLTGKAPYPGGTYHEKMMRHLRGEPTPLEKLRSEIPAGLRAIVRKLMAPRPEERFQTPSELSAALQNLADTEARLPWSIQPPSPWKRRPMIWAVVGMLAMTAAAVALTIAMRREPPAEIPRPGAIVQAPQLQTPQEDLKSAAPSPVPRVFNPDEDAAPTTKAPSEAAKPDDKNPTAKQMALIAKIKPEPQKKANPPIRPAVIAAGPPRLLKTFQGHTGEVTWVAFAPDGSSFASASYDHSVRLWRPDQDEPVARWPHPDKVMCVAYSPDSATLASCTDQEGAVRFWDIATQKETMRGEQKDPQGSLWAVAFRGDGRLLASGSMAAWSKESVKLWDVQGRKPSGSLGTPGDRQYAGVNGLAFCPGTTFLAAGYYLARDTGVRLWDTETKEELEFLAGPAVAVAFAPGGRKLVTAQASEIVIWDVNQEKKSAIKNSAFQSGLSPFQFDPQRGPKFACCAAFAPDNRTLAVAFSDGSVVLWNTDSSKQMAEFTAHNLARSSVVYYRECSVAFAPDGKKLLTGGFDHAVKLWELPTEP